MEIRKINVFEHFTTLKNLKNNACLVVLDGI